MSPHLTVFSELLRLLETEEAQTAALDAQNSALMEELENLKVTNTNDKLSHF
jgi:hypothetical protein